MGIRKSWYKLIQYLKNVDLDVLFAYRAEKEVKILDRKLGLTNIFIVTLIALYILVYVFIINKGYLAYDSSTGSSSTIVRGTAIATSNGKAQIWEPTDIRYPSAEVNALFLTTHAQVTRGQNQGRCMNLKYPCKADNDCMNRPPAYFPKCTSGFCETQNWCPPPGPTTSQFYDLSKLENLTISIVGTISFNILAPGSIYSFNQQIDGVNQFSLEVLLRMAGISITPALIQKGGLFMVNLFWECSDLGGSSCPIKVTISQLDNGAGFTFSQAYYYRVGTTEERELRTLTGLRFLIASTGRAQAVAPNAIILQISCGLALLKIANYVSDFLALYVLPAKKWYKNLMIKETEDYSELDAALEAAEQAKLKKVSRKFKL